VKKNTYAGIIVGGPMAGQRLEHNQRIYRVGMTYPSSLEEVATMLKEAGDEPVKVDHFVYVYGKMGGVYFWSPQSWSAQQIVAELLKKYDKHGAKNDKAEVQG
jgi:hypothetical protein